MFLRDLNMCLIKPLNSFKIMAKYYAKGFSMITVRAKGCKAFYSYTIYQLIISISVVQQLILVAQMSSFLPDYPIYSIIHRFSFDSIVTEQHSLCVSV